MATILEFRRREVCRDGHHASGQVDLRDQPESETRGRDRQARHHATCDILFFTGVRYSRHDDTTPYATADDGEGARTGA